MQLAWLARLVITRRDEAQSTLALSCRCVMSNRWRAFSVHQLFFCPSIVTEREFA